VVQPNTETNAAEHTVRSRTTITYKHQCYHPPSSVQSLSKTPAPSPSHGLRGVRILRSPQVRDRPPLFFLPFVSIRLVHPVGYSTGGEEEAKGQS
jgi:hypothetical protein